MGVLRPRTKMVSLRLSEDEYQQLVELCSVKGAHSTSDLARTAVCDFLLSHDDRVGYRGPAAVDLQQRVGALEEKVRHLGRLVFSATAART